MSDHESTYVPKSGFERWMDTRLPIIRFGMDYANLPTPRNLNYWWTFGGILAVCLGIQLVTGIVLAMHYVPHVDHAFASVERFPGVRLCDEWPDDALARLGLDAKTALVALSHDPKLDDPALELALPSLLFYIGALGSRRTHEKRLERLRAAGLGELTGRIHSPIGLDLGGRSPAEIAVSILAEVIQVRYRGERA